MIELRAGPLRALLDDVDLRYVRIHGVEAFRRVYVAVRDCEWATIPGAVRDLRVDQHDADFRASFAVDHRDGAIDYTWRGTITGSADGQIVYRMEGTANTPFEYNRIGFCVLHPDDECAGQEYWGVGPAGRVEGRLPELVAPQPFEDGRYVPLIPPISSLTIGLRDGGRAHLQCAGDLFETEDQRNWTDASYKTYCTPLALGFPHRADVGQQFTQQVRVSASGVAQSSGGPRGETVTLRLGPPTGHRLPVLGLGPSSAAEAPDHGQLEMLRALGAQHHRVDVHLDDPDWRSTARRSIDVTAGMACPVELVLFASPNDDFTEVATMFADAPLARVLVYAAGAASASSTETTPVELLERARNQLAAYGPVPVGGGTDMYFCELNRTRPHARSMDCVAFSIMPQEHAEDDLSLVETPRAQAATVRTALTFADGRPIVISPVTLLPRGPQPRTDHRQASLLAAAWTAGSIKYLAEAGAHSVSYFEAAGDRGVVTAGGGRTPSYELLAWILARAGSSVVGCQSDDDLRLIGLALAGSDPGDAPTLLVVNLTSGTLDGDIVGLGNDGSRSVRLDHIVGECELVDSHTSNVRLRIGPHAVAAVSD